MIDCRSSAIASVSRTTVSVVDVKIESAILLRLSRYSNHPSLFYLGYDFLIFYIRRKVHQRPATYAVVKRADEPIAKSNTSLWFSFSKV